MITAGARKPAGGKLTGVEKTYNKVRNGLRGIGERGDPLLKTTFRALPQRQPLPLEDRHDRRIGTIVATTLVLLHHEHWRTT